MTILQGTGVGGGIALGRVRFVGGEAARVERRTVSDVEAEWGRFVAARAAAIAEAKGLCEKARREVGEDAAAIFEIHAMMLEDEDFNRAIERSIRTERVSAEYAQATAAEHFSAMLASMDDPYMRARAADVRDISARLGRILSGARERLAATDGELVILFASDLTPSETMRLDRSRVAALVTAEGSVNSHTAILARSLGLPATVAVGNDLFSVADGAFVAVDGLAGKVYVEPDEGTLARFREGEARQRRERDRLEEYRGMESVTRDGRRILLFANAQSTEELAAVRCADAEGIGLFRSEFLYLDRETPPDEEEQLRIYRRILQEMGEKKTVIRTLDIGADKQVAYLSPAHEENPALGLRGARLCLCNPALFRPQLRALFRASVFGNLAIMFPMITSVAEVNELLTLCARTRRELEAEGYSVSPRVELGIMIETPAAALISHRLAPLVDFFSVGTNDLSQYTMAIDRQNPGVLRFFDEHHEGVLRLIAMAAEAAHGNGKWIGICGELAADVRLTERFLRMGIDELSVSPSQILPLRAHVRALDLGGKQKNTDREEPS